MFVFACFFVFCIFLFGGNSHLGEPDDIVMHAFLMNSLLLKIFRATKNLVENGDDIMSRSKQLVYYWLSFVIKWALVLSWYLCWHSGAIPRAPGTVIKLHCKHACNISATVSTVVYESVGRSAMCQLHCHGNDTNVSAVITLSTPFQRSVTYTCKTFLSEVPPT